MASFRDGGAGRRGLQRRAAGGGAPRGRRGATSGGGGQPAVSVGGARRTGGQQALAAVARSMAAVVGSTIGTARSMDPTRIWHPSRSICSDLSAENPSMARKMLKDGEAAVPDGDHYDYDLFVIGAGSGGVRGSRTAASFGAKVAICELPFHPISSDWLGGHGGTCVIRGCVPKKILVYGASFRGEFEDSQNFGWEINGDITFNWKKLLENKTK